MKRLAGISFKGGNREAEALARKIAMLLDKEGFEVNIYPPLKDLPRRARGVTSLEGLKGEFIIGLGGDGTILRTLLAIKSSPIPILGIGIGRMNFLAAADRSNYEEAIHRAIKGDYTLEEAMRIDAWLGDTQLPPVLNEVYFTSDLPGKALRIDIDLEREGKRRPLWSDRADGVLVATPIGSTAYSLSAGGPILDTSMEALILTPVSPMIYRSSIILSPQDRVLIWSDEAETPITVVLDGQLRFKVKPGETLTVARSEAKAYFIRFEEDTRWHRLRKGLRERE